MTEFAPLQSQDVREYWPDEAQDFTPWVANSVRSEETSRLEDVLELDLEVVKVEKSVGRYSMDILAEVVDDNRTVVIENQLESSDHNHLGKSLAYASGVDADIVVWIAQQFYDEHRDAMQWLNQNSQEGINLFALRLEVWTIGDSEPAVRLNPVAEPSEWKKKAQRPEGELSETEKLQEEFWTQFRDRIETRETPLSTRKPKARSWYGVSIGKTGFNISFIFDSQESMLRAGLVIEDDADAYRKLEEKREDINQELDKDLVWNKPKETRSGKERSKLMFSKETDVTDQERWDEYLDWMIERGESLHDAFHDRIQQL
jgi:hypothetical protein